MTECAECGMPIESATEYHPYAACLMFKECYNSEIVRSNLNAVIEHAALAEREELREGVR